MNEIRVCDFDSVLIGVLVFLLTLGALNAVTPLTAQSVNTAEYKEVWEATEVAMLVKDVTLSMPGWWSYGYGSFSQSGRVETFKLIPISKIGQYSLLESWGTKSERCSFVTEWKVAGTLN